MSKAHVPSQDELEQRVLGMDDTSSASEARYYELLRQQSPMQRLRTALLLTQAVRHLAELDIRRVHPNASHRQVQAFLAERLYGEAVARRLFPPAEDHAD